MPIATVRIIPAKSGLFAIVMEWRFGSIFVPGYVNRRRAIAAAQGFALAIGRVAHVVEA